MTYPAFYQDPARGCASGRIHPETFFATPRQHGTTAQKQTAEQTRELAKWLCKRRCPFTAQCFTWAATQGERHGVWGGVDMADTRDVARARVEHGIVVTEPAEPLAETDEVMVERMLATGGRAAYRALTEDQRRTVIQAGLRRGFSLNHFARQYRTNCRALRALVGDDADGFDQKVRRLYHAGQSDPAIALVLDCDPKVVARARARMGLRTMLGPGGRLRRRIGDAQKALHAEVTS